MSLDHTLRLALQHHQAGQLAPAEALYRQIIQQQPNHAVAIHLLGVLAAQSGRRDLAIDLIRQAIVLRPGIAEFHSNLANALHEAGRVDDAIASYRMALTLKPEFAEGHSNLGNALCEAGRIDEAIACHERAVALKPQYAEGHVNLGNALRSKGRLDDAIACHRRAIALKPAYAKAFLNLGNALRDARRFDEAVDSYQRAIALDPNNAEARTNLGNALRDLGRANESIASHEHAIALKPDYAEAFSNLGNVFLDIGRLDEAIACQRRAVALKPEYALGHSNLGNALIDKDFVDESIACYRRAIKLRPSCAEAHMNLGLALLTRGDLAEGWAENEWRWQVDPAERRHVDRPRWEGSTLAGRTILLTSEQGFGDTIQFVRYVELVKARGVDVVVQCQPNLVRLFRASFAGVVIVDESEAPRFDVHCPLMSLPLVFGTTLETIPRQVPYVRPEPIDVERCRPRFAGEGTKVGVVWAGFRGHKNDHNRSMPLAALRPLLQTPQVRFYSLQKGDAAKDAIGEPGLVDWTDDVREFADTAAMIAHLDLVISVDTSVAHLAGAMGKPTWLLLPFAPDWRWMRGRDDSPWYPPMRLFRQPAIGDWRSVVDAVRESLCDVCTEGAQQVSPGQRRERSIQ